MKILEPEVIYMPQDDPWEHIAECAAVCYNATPKKGEAAKTFVDKRVADGHTSILRHSTKYFKLDIGLEEEDYYSKSYLLRHLAKYAITGMTPFYEYFAVNYEDLLNMEDDMEDFVNCEASIEEVKHECPDIIRYTFQLNTGIDISRELNRVSPNNITESSTRYIKIGTKCEPAIVRPHWMLRDFADNYNKGIKVFPDLRYSIFTNRCESCFNDYMYLMEPGNDFRPQMPAQDARKLLPLGTATKVIYTYSLREWRHIIGLRYHEITGPAHPDAKGIIGLLKDQLESLSGTAL